MRKNILVLFAFALAAVLCFSACELLDSSGNNGIFGDSVDSRLWGTWNTVVQTTPPTPPSHIGKLKISYNSIDISGYTATGNNAPFNVFSKPATYIAKSEKTEETDISYKGILKISNKGEWEEISFTYYWNPSPYQYFLKFKFGSTEQILRKE